VGEFFIFSGLLLALAPFRGSLPNAALTAKNHRAIPRNVSHTFRNVTYMNAINQQPAAGKNSQSLTITVQ